jgi:probable HAF family extracellular repeat protein
LKLPFRFILLLAGVWSVAQAAPLTYTYTPISVPGSSSTEARALNNAGQIVGAYTNSTGTHGFLYSNGTYTTLDAPGGTATNLLGINNGGQIVGTYHDSSNRLQLFTESNGVFTTINVPNGLDPSQFLAAGINDAGQVVGTANRATPLQTNSPFLYDNGQFTFYPLGSINTAYYASSINNAGQVAMSRANGPVVDAGLYSNGTFTQISGLGSADMIATGINNAGVVVGIYEGTNDDGGFIYDHGTLTAFSDRSSRDFSSIYGINDAGQLVGSGSNVSISILATPTTAPEPGSLLLVGSGITAVACFTRKRWKKA